VQPADIINADVLGSSLNSTSVPSAQKQNGRVRCVLLSQLDPIATCTLKKKVKGMGGGGGGGGEEVIEHNLCVVMSIGPCIIVIV